MYTVRVPNQSKLVYTFLTKGGHD